MTRGKLVAREQEEERDTGSRRRGIEVAIAVGESYMEQKERNTDTRWRGIQVVE